MKTLNVQIALHEKTTEDEIQQFLASLGYKLHELENSIAAELLTCYFIDDIIIQCSDDICHLTPKAIPIQ